mgnify:CR=1 FL=1
MCASIFNGGVLLVAASFLSGNLFFHFTIGFSQKWCFRPFLFLSSGPEMVAGMMGRVN